jgi:hypothetical protein
MSVRNRSATEDRLAVLLERGVPFGGLVGSHAECDTAHEGRFTPYVRWWLRSTRSPSPRALSTKLREIRHGVLPRFNRWLLSNR